MGSFVNSFRNNANWTTTANGAAVRSTTGSALLNLFARIGGMRNADEAELIRMWRDARSENEELADNLILYSRSIRSGGIGERRISRILLKELAKLNPDKVCRNFDTIVEAGRWDDLYCLEGTSIWNAVMAYIGTQFKSDILNMSENKPISLLAKWLPSENTSSKETRRLARVFIKAFGLTEKKYRKALSALRKYLDVVEKKMSAREFAAIDYEKVPSLAMTRYRSSFGRHDFERFNGYINAVSKGEKKINSSVLYPYDLTKNYVNGCGWYLRSVPVDPVIEEQWKALPNYVDGEYDVVCLCDVSGSMKGQPMATSIGLGIYFAEHNKGAYKNLVMSFTDIPSFYELNPNDTLATRVCQIMSHEGYNTDLDRAFQEIYDIAKTTREVPKALIVISDGELDAYAQRLERDGSSYEDIAEKWQAKYCNIGLEAPKLIMWNVNSFGNHFITGMENRGVAYVSGSSAATFKELLTLITSDAYTAMTEILSRDVFCWK